MQNAKYLSEKALKAMHALFQIIYGVETPRNVTLQLFDSLVVSILNYGCESRGFLNVECIERIYRKFLKYILNVKTSTNNYALYKELGRYRFSIERQLRNMKYWFKLLDSANSNCILKQVYNSMPADMAKPTSSQKTSWINRVKDLMDNNGFTDV